MSFKSLTNELILQGWRCYIIPPYVIKGDSLEKFARKFSLEVRVYEGKSIVFVKNKYV